MDLKLTQENLSKALNVVARVASGRSTLPILSNILLKTTNNRLQLSATNLDIAITEFVGTKVSKEGAITVPARLMQDFISSLPSGTVQLKQEDNKLHITTDNYSSTLNGVSSEDFPVIPNIKDGDKWDVEAKALKQALQPVLTGVFITSNKEKLSVAATDSYRLAEKTTKSPKDGIKILLPSNAAQELLRIIGDEDEKITIAHDGQQARFKTTRTELIARLIDGEYPQYQKLIPSKFECTATLAKNDLANIAKVSSLFARESAGSVVLKLDKESKKVIVQSVASQVGENSSSADAVVSANGEITLNSRYLMDALNVIEGDKVEINFNGKVDPLLIRNPDKKDYLHIVMPLKS
jgi:DNA polymerase-3 subunit beta